VRERAAVLGIRRYVQAHVLATPFDSALDETRGSSDAPFDGVAEFWVDSLEALAATYASAEGQQASRELLEDERRFIDVERSPIRVAEEHEVIAVGES
jgi:EthD domain